MNLSELTAKQFKELKSLIEKKEALIIQVEKLNRKIETFAGHSPIAKPRAVGRPRSPKRGKLKASILKALDSAGAKGVKLKDLSILLKAKMPNLYAWFSTTGKTIKGLEKVGPGQYALKK